MYTLYIKNDKMYTTYLEKKHSFKPVIFCCVFIECVFTYFLRQWPSQENSVRRWGNAHPVPERFTADRGQGRPQRAQGRDRKLHVHVYIYTSSYLLRDDCLRDKLKHIMHAQVYIFLRGMGWDGGGAIVV